jgi:hypothetical protein
MEGCDLEGLGENTLRLWTTQVGISANKADPDKTVWDFLLEFPHSYDSLIDVSLPFVASIPLKRPLTPLNVSSI